MKRILIPALLSLAGTLAFAQTPQTAPAPDAQPAPMHRHAPSPERQTRHLAKALNLTPDQAAKVEPILASRDQQVQALFQNQQLAPQDRHTQMKAIHESTEQQLATVLTPDQLQQLKAMRHDHRGRGQWGKQQPAAPPAA